jgi:translocation and assembly module TamB
MTTDSSATPPPETPGNATPGGSDTPPPARRKRRLWKALAWAIGVPLLLVALVGGALYGAVATERGTAYAWQAAVKLLCGRLTGTLAGGALATGVRLRQVEWRSLDGSGTDIKIDRVDGRWAVTGRPWRFAIDYLRVGTIDARIGSSSSSSSEPIGLPKALLLPMQVDIRDVRVDTLLLRQGGSTAEYSHFLFHGRSDGRHHEAAIEQLDTPFGAVTASAKLDGVRPFPLTGDIGYSGKVNAEPVQVSGHLSGSLEKLVAELDASGMKLAGHARVEATPFADVPLQRATLTFDHVNPQAFAPGAPLADLAVRAELQPVTAGVKGDAAGFVVAGQVSVVNAKPGTIDEHLLPLIDAHADVRLDAHTQSVSNLNLRLVKNATITGAGTLAGKRGQLDLQVARLDLNALQASVRPTQLAGPIGIRLNDDVQSITLDLADTRAALRAQGKITFDPARMSFSDVRITSGRGRIDLSGAIKHDASSTYNLKAQLTDFDPLGLTAQMTSRPSANTTSNGTTRSPARAVAPGATPNTASPNLQARVNGTLIAAGVLGPTFTTRAEFKLGESVYDNLPMTGSGTIQLVGSRILPSRATLSVAGNQVDLQGSFGAPGDRLRFRIDAPQIERLGFGLAGVVAADGDVTGSFAHPNVVLNYKADSVVFGANRLGHAEGHAELRDGANGALVFTTDARDLSTNGVELSTFSARLNGTRARHTLQAQALGKLYQRPLELALAASGGLSDTAAGTRWDGTLTQLQNRGTPALKLESPLTVSAGANRVILGATRLTLEGAVLDLKSFALDHGRIQSTGSLTDVSVTRLMALWQEFTGEPPPVKTDLVFDGDWDFALGNAASGHLQFKRRSGDVTVEIGSGLASMGITDLTARADFSAGNRLNATVHAQASRIGVIDADAHTTLAMNDGVLGLNDQAPVSGNINANVPSLKTTGGLFGPGYMLDGHLALKLALGGTVARPDLSGALAGDGLSVTMIDQGIQLKDGVIRIALSQNLVDLQQVEFHGGSGTLRATGRVRLDGSEPDLTANLVADKLELFAAPDRKLSLSGSATVANGGHLGAMDINGKFTVDRALFDMPEQAAPSLGDDVVIVRPDGTVPGESKPGVIASDKPVSHFTPHANVEINLGSNFRFRGQGADLGLTGTITATSAPDSPLRAVGNVRVTQGSTYTAFGRKLNIENGFFTFNGPVANPGINILAMRRNQQVEAGVQVTGTVNAPVAKLVSEPSVPDNEKLSWLLFGHGTDQGNNLGQQSAMTTALALLGNSQGKRIAQTFGLDEFSIGTSEVGLTDPQVVMVSKAVNQWLVLGYEQGLQSASNAIKATVNLTRYWSVVAYGGTFQGMNLLYTRRFNRWPWFNKSAQSAQSAQSAEPVDGAQ